MPFRKDPEIQRRLSQLLLLALTSFLTFFAGATEVNLPDLGSPADATLSKNTEAQIGRSIMRQIRASGQLVEDPQITEYINDIGHRISAQANDGAHTFTFFGHILMQKVDASLKTDTLNLLQVGHAQRLAQKIHAAFQIANHDPVFRHVVMRLRDIAGFVGRACDEPHLFWRRRDIVQQVQQDCVSKFCLAQL